MNLCFSCGYEFTYSSIDLPVLLIKWSEIIQLDVLKKLIKIEKEKKHLQHTKISLYIFNSAL